MDKEPSGKTDKAHNTSNDESKMTSAWTKSINKDHSSKLGTPINARATSKALDKKSLCTDLYVSAPENGKNHAAVVDVNGKSITKEAEAHC